MATKQKTNFIRNLQDVPTPIIARVLHTASFSYTWTADTVAADIIELGVLPAGCKLYRADFVSANIGLTGTVDVGFMTGTVGDKDSVRTMAATGEIINDGAKNGTITVGPAVLDAIASTDEARSIGVKWSADETAGGTETVSLVISYYAD